MSVHEEFAHLKLQLEEIVKATKNFADQNLIGQGGFGNVYKGNILVSGKPLNIAANKLHYDYGQHDLEFWNAISMLANLKHENLVSFIGFCNEKGEKIIINEYEVNGSLERHLSSTTLTWMQRLQICVGVARALSYIHYDDGHAYSVIHRNIKSSKILLDETWKPKLSGFEYSLTNTKDRRHRLVFAEIVGSIGYVDPAYEKTGFVSHKSDVYSFGVVLFEVLCGRRAFVPQEREQLSPQYFTEQDHNDEKLDHITSKPPSFGYSFKQPSRPPSSSGEQRCSFTDQRPPSSGGQARSFVKKWPPSSGGPPRSFVDQRPPSSGGQPPSFADQRPQSFIRSLHSPNQELLAQLAKSHYEEENLDDIIHPDLWKQMDPKSFKIFSETAYNCLKENRVERPNIDQILRNLEQALELQMKDECPVDSIIVGEVEETIDKVDSIIVGKVEETISDLDKGRRLEHLKIPLADIIKATKNFKQIYLGSGSYGDVYKAELEVPTEKKTKGAPSRKLKTVAIKCIREDEQAEKGFNAEIDLLTSCRHKNIVSLLGFCNEGSKMILIYEYAHNNSLDKYLETTHNNTNFTWVQRVKFGIDIARGLNYIHTRIADEHEMIIHRDIKSANILLGKNWVAKIADFGLSRFHRANQKEECVYTTNVAGTEYYVCPEYKETGRLKTAVDIYSFGVVLFEIVSGKLAYEPIYVRDDKNGIAYVARQFYKDKKLYKIVDTKIMEEVDVINFTLGKGPNQDSLGRYLEIARRCVEIKQDLRPTAKEVLEELQNALYLQEKERHSFFKMSLEEIKLATQNFSRDNLIGKGGFGTVFKGELTRGNGSITIAIKRMDRSHCVGENHIPMELEILLEYRHENIIRAQGYCDENDEKIIVYEHVSNGSLDRYLNDVSLTWLKRLQICINIARGLAFLHGGSPTKEMVIHRDIKTSNILLSGDWKAKISDFGLSVITAINQEVRSNLVGTCGYVDPQNEITGFFTEKSDIYSLGVVLFEILYGQLLVRTKDYDEQNATRILEQIHDEGKLELIVFKDIKEQIDPQSLSTFRVIVSQCLYTDRKKRPTAEEVLQQLKKSLKCQMDYELWEPKLPEDYEEILKSSMYSKTYSTKRKKELYKLLSRGILLQDVKVIFSLGSNGERNEMISAMTFSYRNSNPHDKWRIVSESRFEKVAQMVDISNLMINVKTRTQFLSPNTIYGVYLVFKFCDSKNISNNPVYVNLKYRMESKTLHAYFAKWRDDEWMMIEFYRFLSEKKDGDFMVLLESLSPCYCREHDAVYVEGIEFRPIDNVGHEETEKPKEMQQALKSNSNTDLVSERIFKGSITYDYGEELLSLTEVNDKKHLMLSPKAAVWNFSDVTLFSAQPSTDSRFGEVLELLPQLVFRISCKIKSKMLSWDAEYMCYLVFKLSEKCHELHGPVEVRDLLQKNKVAEIIYFRSPSPWNIHNFTRVPELRKDGWMEVNIWKFNSNDEHENDCVLLNLKFTSYKNSMSGLIVCGLEFRPR